MKFEYIGSDGARDLDLVYYGIMNKEDVLVKGLVFTVPDEEKDLIRRLNINGNYRPIRVGRKRSRRR